MKTQRLDQFIAHTTTYSRKEAKAILKQGRITINGVRCKSSKEKINTSDTIALDQHPLEAQQHVYFALNKPANYCCSHEDDGHPSALYLLPESQQKLLFAGRLDADTTGLIFISTDGKWCHRVSHPSHSRQAIGKVYAVTLAEPFTEAEKLTLSQGILLKNESKPTLPCNINIIHSTLVHIELFEGKYHQVKRMFAAVGNKVNQLERLSIHGVKLDKLERGQFRVLSPAEIKLFTQTNNDQANA